MPPSPLPFGYLPEGPAVRHPLSLFLRPSLAEGRQSATPASLLPASYPSYFPSPSIELPPLGTPSGYLVCLGPRVEEGHAATPLSLAPLLPEVSTTRTPCRCSVSPFSSASSSLPTSLLLSDVSPPPPLSLSSPLSPPLLDVSSSSSTSPPLPRRLLLFLDCLLLFLDVSSSSPTSPPLPRRLLPFCAVFSLLVNRPPPSCLVSLPSSAPPSFPSAVTPRGKAVAIPSPRLFCLRGEGNIQVSAFVSLFSIGFPRSPFSSCCSSPRFPPPFSPQPSPLLSLRLPLKPWFRPRTPPSYANFGSTYPRPGGPAFIPGHDTTFQAHIHPLAHSLWAGLLSGFGLHLQDTR